MATRYWVGGSGTWSDISTTNWSATSGGASGASAPTTADDVVFDANSNVGTGAFTVTLSGAPRCQNFTVSPSGSPLDGAMSLGGTAPLTISGGLSWPSTNFTRTNSGAITFSATTTGNVITTNGSTLTTGNVTFNGVGGGWSLGSALSVGTLAGITFTNGTFSTANFSVTTGSISIGLSSGSVSFGSSTISVTGAFPFSYTSGTFNAGTSSINISASTASTFTGGGATFYDVSFTMSSGNTALTFAGANTFNNLSFSCSSFGSSVSLPANQTINATLTTTGTDQRGRCLFKSSVYGTQRTLSAAAVSLTNADFLDIAASGAATWSGTSIGNLGGNTGITFTTPKTVYLVGSGAINLGGNVYAATSGGAAALTSFPLAQDTVIIDNSTGATSYDLCPTSRTWTPANIDATSRTTAISVIATVAPTLYGSFQISSSVTANITSVVTLRGRVATQILQNTTGLTQITADTLTGTVQIGANNSVSSSCTTLTLNSGTLDLNGFTINPQTVSTSVTTTRSIAFNGGQINLTGTGTVWSASTATGFSYTGTPTININASTSLARSVSHGSTGATAANTPSFYVSAGSGTFTTNGAVNTLDFTGFSGSWANTITSIYGNLVVSSGMTVTAGTGTRTFAATSGTQTVTTNGKTLDFPTTVSCSGATFQLNDALTLGSTRTLTHTSGTVNLNGFTLTASVYTASSGSPIIAMSSGAIVVTGSGAAFTALTGTTFTGASTGTISFTSASAKSASIISSTASPTINQGGSGALSLSFGAGGSGGVANDLTATVVPSTIAITAGGSLTVNNFSLSGTVLGQVTLKSTTNGSRATISKASGTVSTSFLTIQDIAATGGATWNAFLTNGNLDGGNNTGWNFVAGGNVTVAVTGVQATGAVGTATVLAIQNATVSLTGVQATGAVGTVTVTNSAPITVFVTGVQATGAVGSVTVITEQNTSASVTGVQATGAVGTVIASVSTTSPVTGVEAIGAVGSVTVTVPVTVQPIGVQATGSIGAVTVVAVQNTVVPTTGVQATGNIGAVSVAIGIDAIVTGVQATGYVGNTTQVISVTVTPVGVVGYGEVGFALVWGPIDDQQDANWQNVDTQQAVAWQNINDTQSPNWQWVAS